MELTKLLTDVFNLISDKKVRPSRRIASASCYSSRIGTFHWKSCRHWARCVSFANFLQCIDKGTVITLLYLVSPTTEAIHFQLSYFPIGQNHRFAGCVMFFVKNKEVVTLHDLINKLCVKIPVSIVFSRIPCSSCGGSGIYRHHENQWSWCCNQS